MVYDTVEENLFNDQNLFQLLFISYYYTFMFDWAVLLKNAKTPCLSLKLEGTQQRFFDLQERVMKSCKEVITFESVAESYWAVLFGGTVY